MGTRGRRGRAAWAISALAVLVGSLATLPRAEAAVDPETPPVPTPFEVTLTDAGFDPATIDVVVGQSIVITNTGSTTRRIQGADTIFDSGDVPVGGAFTVAIPDDREVAVTSPAAGAVPVATATIRVGPNGFSGPGDSPVSLHLPTGLSQAEDLDSFAVEPTWGLTVSRTTIVLQFRDSATVAEANRALAAANARLAGRTPNTPILMVTIPDPGDGTFDDLHAALDALRSSPGVLAAALDPLGDSADLPGPLPATVVSGGFNWVGYPTPAGAPSGSYGVEQARFPQAWNLLDAIRKAGSSKVDIGVVDTGYDLAHPELAPAAGGSKRIDFLPNCLGICVGNPPGIPAQGHGTGVAAQLAGANVGANPTAHLVASAASASTKAGPGGSTFFSALGAVNNLLLEKQKGTAGVAPNLRAINLSINSVSFAQAGAVWATTFRNRTCGPGAADDAGGTGACTPNTEDGYLREIAQIGKVDLALARVAASQDVVIVQAAGNDSGVSGNATFCTPLGQTPCTTYEKIRASSKSGFAWASANWPDGVANPIIVVGAIDAQRQRASFSNVGADVSAAGVNTVSANAGGGYRTFGGTSGASPYVAALAGLVAQFAPTLTAGQIRQLIIDHAIADVGPDAAPRIDAFATLTGAPEGLIAALDVNDPSADGNRRVVSSAPRSGVPVSRDDALGPVIDGVALHSEADGAVDMRDLRRFRDQWLQTCGTSSSSGCPAASTVVLDGAADHPKKDLNDDGCTAACPVATTLYPRADPVGLGTLDLTKTAPLGVDTLGRPSRTNLPFGALTAYAAAWGTTRLGGEPANTEGWAATDLPALMLSGDLEVHLDALQALGATQATVSAQRSSDGKTWTAVGKPRTVSLTGSPPLRDGVVVLTIPLTPSAGGTLVRVGATATIGTKTVTTTRPKGHLKVGQDVRIDPKVVTATMSVAGASPSSKAGLARSRRTPVKVTLLANGKRRGTAASPGAPVATQAVDRAGNAEATTAEEATPDDFDDGTDALADAPIEFTAEGTGDDPAAPSIASADATTDALGEATAEVDAGATAGDAELSATATVDDAPVTVVVDATVRAPTHLVYTWEQTITDWSRHYEGLVPPDPSDPTIDGTYDYDEDGGPSAAPVVLERSGTVDLDAATPTLDETTGPGAFTIHTTTPFGQSTVSHSILPALRTTTGLPLDRVSVERDDGSVTISGLKQISDVDHLYDCAQLNQCGFFNRGFWIYDWLTITRRNDPFKFAEGDGTSIQFAPSVDADLHLQRDGDGSWVPYSYCGSDDVEFDNWDGVFTDVSGTAHVETRFTATLVDEGGDPVLELPNCTNPLPPKATFHLSPTAPKAGEPVTFTDDSVAPAGLASWAWDFGDGTTSTKRSPDHLFADSGSYTVKLTVTDGRGRTASTTRTITVVPGPPTVSVDDLVASSSDHATLHGRISSPGEFDRRSLTVNVSSPAAGFPRQVTRRLPAGPIDLDLGQLDVGTYEVIVTVSDLAGQTATDTATVTVVAGAAPPTTDPDPVTIPPASGCDASFEVPGEAADLVTALSDLRAAAGRLDLLVSPTLQEAAQRHADDLAAHLDLTDVGSDGSTLADRLGDAGYPDGAETDQLVLRGPKLPADALATWQNRTADAEALLDRTWVAAGAARAEGTDGRWVWVVVLGEVIDCAADGGGANAARLAAAPAAPRVAPSQAPAPAPAPAPTATTEPASGPEPATAAAPSAADPVAARAPAPTTSAIGDLPAVPVPAFTIDDATPAAGAAVKVHNRTRLRAELVAGRFDPGDGRPTIPVDVGGTVTTSWYSAGSASPAVQAADGAGVVARADIVTAGATVAPAITYSGATTGAQGAGVVVTATVTRAGTGTPMPGRPVQFTVGASTAVATSGADGKATTTLVIAPGTPAGLTQLTATALAVGPSASASTTSPFTVTTNAPPVADAGGPYDLILGRDLLLDGTGSSDANGDPLTYRWKIGTGDFGIGDLQPALPFDQFGPILCGGPCEPEVAYPIALQVIDDHGAASVDATTITLHRDFALVITPPSTLLNPGASTSYNLSVLTDNGFTDPIALSINGLPTGVTASLPPTVEPGRTVVLTVTAAADAPAVTAGFTVTGTAKGITRQVGGSIDLEFGLIPACTGSLEGTVTDRETGAPLADVGVARFNTGSVTRTDANGHYLLENIAVGRTNQPITDQFNFGKDGSWPANPQATIACNLVTHLDVSLIAKHTTSFSGRVTEGTRDLTDPQSPVISTGVPLPGARVASNSGVPGATTAADGTYTISNVPLSTNNGPTGVSVNASVDGYWMGFGSGTLTLAGPNVIDLVAVKACYGDAYVKVIDDTTGRPVADSKVTVSAARPEGVTAFPTAFTDANGIAHLTDVPLARDNRPQTAAFGSAPPAGSNLQPVLATTTFTLPSCGSTGLGIGHLKSPPPTYTASARIRVVDADTGEPIPGVGVRGPTGNATTDDQGWASFPSIALLPAGATTGSFYGVAEPPGWYGDGTGSFDLARDETAERTIRLHRKLPATITGRVTDLATGLPISNIQVAAVGLGVQTDADGRYSITDTFLQPINAPTSVGVSSAGNAQYWPSETSTVITATAAGPNVADLKLQRRCAPAFIYGTVRSATTHELLEGAQVTDGGRPVFTDAQGRFQLTSAARNYDRPTSVDITASKAGFLTATKRIQIYCGAEIELDFGQASTGVGSVTGTVTRASDGTPVAGVTVGGAWGATATTSSNGTYTLADAPLGEGGADKAYEITALPTIASKLASESALAVVSSQGPTTQDFSLEGPDEVAAVAAVDDVITVDALADTRVPFADGVLANDAGGGLVATVATGPAKGTLTLYANGGLLFSPSGDVVGDVPFTYTATDAAGRTDTATAILRIVGPPAPTAGDDTITTKLNTGAIVTDPTKGLFANDTGTGITFDSVTPAVGGKLQILNDGGWVFNPNVGYFGTSTVQYTIKDRFGRKAVGTITIIVTADGDPPPKAFDDLVSTAFETPLAVPAPGVLTNDAGTALTVTAHTNPAHGTVAIAADGSYTYTPAAGYAGGDTFTYTVTDSSSRTATATVRITVEPKVVATRYAIGDAVFRDADADGIQDPGEPAAPGVAVQLLDANGSVLAATTTDPSGRYAFDDLAAGDYGVRFTAPPGFAFSPAAVGGDRAVDSDPDGAGLVAAFRLEQGVDGRLAPVGPGDLATVASQIDRTIDAGLVALPSGLSVVATARRAGTTEPFSTTAQGPKGSSFDLHVAVTNTGDAALSAVAVTDATVAGCAKAIGALAAGATSEYDCTGAFTPTADAVVAPHASGTADGGGTVEADARVTIELTTSLGDRVWEDLDHDGVQDQGEPGIEGVAVALLGPGDAVLATAETGADGTYELAGLRPGSYRVRFARPDGYRWTLADAGGDDARDSDAKAADPLASTARTDAVAVGTDDLTSLDAGLWRPASLAGDAYADADHDGTRDAGEDGVAGVVVELLDGDGGVVDTATTPDGGAFAFGDVIAGTYRLRWTPPDGYEGPTPNAAPVTSGAIRLAPGQAVTGYDLAVWPRGTTTTTTSTTSTTTSTTTTSTSTTTSTTTSSTSTTTSTTSSSTTSTTAPPGTSTSTSTPASTTSTSPPGSSTTAAVSPTSTSSVPLGGGSVDDGTLTRTGSAPGPLLAVALGLLATGGLVLLGRRRVRLRRG
ncbi:MAG: cadherin-like domain-containing protein [Acidimicrobiales bacterium]|nr:cadherin-like domain-containing protein [Acidimicrobiales bacterium]